MYSWLIILPSWWCFTNPFEKFAPQNGFESSPPKFGVKIQKNVGSFTTGVWFVE